MILDSGLLFWGHPVHRRHMLTCKWLPDEVQLLTEVRLLCMLIYCASSTCDIPSNFISDVYGSQSCSKAEILYAANLLLTLTVPSSDRFIHGFYLEQIDTSDVPLITHALPNNRDIKMPNNKKVERFSHIDLNTVWKTKATKTSNSVYGTQHSYNRSQNNIITMLDFFALVLYRSSRDDET